MVKAWAGIANGTISKWAGASYGFDKEPLFRAIFTRKKEAQMFFGLAVPCTIIYSLPTRKKQK